ncbi:MAG: hypothetical protein IPO81_00600 [Kouleothrix sp.]|nr:hypothetical protein [Kouleothrix sp.]
MVTHDDIRRAQLIAAVRQESQRLAPAFDTVLRGVELSNHRVSTITNSLAWHERRQTPELRVRELMSETLRLLRKADTQSDEAQVYRLLLDWLLGKITAEEKATPKDEIEAYWRRIDRLEREEVLAGWEAQLLRLLRLPEAERLRWSQQARLLYAQALVQIVQLHTRGARFRKEIETQGGAVQWQQ